MSKTIQIQPGQYLIADLERADKALEELADLAQKILAIRLDSDLKIRAAREKAAVLAAPLERRKKILADALEAFARRKRLCAGVLRGNIELAHGSIGFRPRRGIRRLPGVSRAMSVQRLKSAGLFEGIRVREEINMGVLRFWSPEMLNLVGLTGRDKYQFFIELVNDSKIKAASEAVFV